MYERKRLGALDLEYREIGGLVTANHRRRILRAVGRADGDFLDLPLAIGSDHVIIGDEVAVGRDEEARSERLRLTCGRLGTAALLVAEQVRKRSPGERIVADG